MADANDWTDEEREQRAKELHVESDMVLPKYRTCGDCVHIIRCVRLFGVKWANKSCGWSPSQFQKRKEEE